MMFPEFKKEKVGNEIQFCKMIKKFKIIDDNANPQQANINMNKVVTKALTPGVHKALNARIHHKDLTNNTLRGRNKINQGKTQEESVDEEKIVNHSFINIEENNIIKEQPICQYNNQDIFDLIGDLRKKQSKSTSKYEKNNIKFYKTGFAFNKVRANQQHQDSINKRNLLVYQPPENLESVLPK